MPNEYAFLGYDSINRFVRFTRFFDQSFYLVSFLQDYSAVFTRGSITGEEKSNMVVLEKSIQVFFALVVLEFGPQDFKITNCFVNMFLALFRGLRLDFLYI